MKVIVDAEMEGLKLQKSWFHIVLVATWKVRVGHEKEWKWTSKWYQQAIKIEVLGIQRHFF